MAFFLIGGSHGRFFRAAGRLRHADIDRRADRCVSSANWRSAAKNLWDRRRIRFDRAGNRLRLLGCGRADQSDQVQQFRQHRPHGSIFPGTIRPADVPRAESAGMGGASFQFIRLGGTFAREGAVWKFYFGRLNVYLVPDFFGGCSASPAPDGCLERKNGEGRGFSAALSAGGCFLISSRVAFHRFFRSGAFAFLCGETNRKPSDGILLLGVWMDSGRQQHFFNGCGNGLRSGKAGVRAHER